MDYVANSAYVVDDNKLKELNLPGYKKFLNYVSSEYFEPEFLFSIIENERGVDLQLETLWESLQREREFFKATQLTLWLGYHDSVIVDRRYDKVEGLYFFADRVVSPTLASAKALRNGIVAHRTWVTFE